MRDVLSCAYLAKYFVFFIEWLHSKHLVINLFKFSLGERRRFSKIIGSTLLHGHTSQMRTSLLSNSFEVAIFEDVAVCNYWTGHCINNLLDHIPVRRLPQSLIDMSSMHAECRYSARLDHASEIHGLLDSVEQPDFKVTCTSVGRFLPVVRMSFTVSGFFRGPSPPRLTSRI